MARNRARSQRARDLAAPDARDGDRIEPRGPEPGPASRRKAKRQLPGSDDPGSWAVVALGVAFLASGAAGLAHEVVWTRLLGHLFGVSSFAISTVLAAYMGGLALGSWWIGTRTANIVDSRRVYAIIEIAIGLFALAIPGLLALAEPLYADLWRRFHLSFGVFTVLRFLLAGSILLVPTALMGATLPVLADDLVRRAGKTIPPHALYALNLAGAVVGVATAGFLLLPNVGVWGTIVTAAVVNIAVGLMVFSLPPTPARAETDEASEVSAAEPVRGRGRHRGQPIVFDLPPSGLLALAAFVSGLVTIASQVAWTRVLSLVIGSTTFAFTSVLLVYLTALGAGSALAVRIGRRRELVGGALAVAFAATALLAIFAVILVHRLPSWYLGLFAIWGAEAEGGVVARGIASAFIVMFPPVLCAGTILPLTLAAALPSEPRETGRTVGRIYAVNTLGSITGAILGGFLLVPGIGTQRTLLALAVVCLAVAIAFGFTLERPAWLRPTVVAAGVIGAMGCLLVPRWNHMRLHAGVFEVARHFGGTDRLRERLDMPNPDSLGQLLYEREGRTASVMVMQTGPIRGMKIDARANASDDSSDMATQVMLALYPLALAPDAKDVFIVGWGSGVTVGAALQTPIESLTAVELEPAVVEASQFYNHLNHDPLSDERVRLFEDDARHILLASEDTYDVIISEPPHPWVSGVANLFTQDFYQLAARRLRPGGVFAQWVQSYQISFDTYRSILASFNSVFDYTYVLYVLGSVDTILIGSREPLRFDPEELARVWADPEIAAELARVGMVKPEYLLAGISIGPEQVGQIVRNATLNTDDNMLVEFQATRGVTAAGGGNTILWELETRATPIGELVPDSESFIADREKMIAYVEGLRAMERNASELEAQLGITPPSEGTAAPPVAATAEGPDGAAAPPRAP